MKLNKLIIGAVLAGAAAFAGAQNVSFHGYMDYTNFAVGQEFSQSGAGDWTHTDASAEFGSFYNGRTELNINVNAGSFDFNAGMRLDTSGNSWYDLYKDVTQEYESTPFHQMNMKIGFLNDQLFVYTGKFEEWNAGYIMNGYELGGQNIRNLADRDNGQHFTAVEFVPNMSIAGGALVGLRVLAGVPVLPVSGNGLQYTEYNQWKNLYKAVKIAAAYKSLALNMNFTAGWRPGTYYYGVESYSSGNFTTNYFGEGFVQVDMPTLVPGVKLNASYDIRYRTPVQTGKLTTAHYAGISGSTAAIPGITLNFEDRFFYADDHYIAVNEKVLFDVLGLSVAHAFENTPYVVGCAVRGAYGVDANGTAFPSGRISSAYSDDFSFSYDWFNTAAPVAGGANNYMSAYAYPYFQKNFQNGYFKVGVEVQYSRFWRGDSANQMVDYRVPCAFCFWF